MESPLADGELIELVGRAKGGDIEARNRVVMANKGLVNREAKRVVRRGRLSFDDLYQEGQIGLMKAIPRYDPRKGKFSTYATHWIRDSIATALSNQSRMIRLPEHVIRLLDRMSKARTALRNEGIDHPSFDECARRARLSDSQKCLVIRADFGVGEIDEDMDHQADLQLFSDAEREEAMRALDELDEPLRSVVRFRHGLSGEGVVVFRDIGTKLGYSHRWCQMAYARAIEQLRSRIVGRDRGQKYDPDKNRVYCEQEAEVFAEDQFEPKEDTEIVVAVPAARPEFEAITDSQWSAIEPMMPRSIPGKNPRAPFRAVIDAIRYKQNSRCTWDRMPPEYPSGRTIQDYFRRWVKDGTWGRITEILGRNDDLQRSA